MICITHTPAMLPVGGEITFSTRPRSSSSLINSVQGTKFFFLAYLLNVLIDLGEVHPPTLVTKMNLGEIHVAGQGNTTTPRANKVFKTCRGSAKACHAVSAAALGHTPAVNKKYYVR